MANAKYIKDGYLVVGGISQRGCVSYTHSGRKKNETGERLEEDWETHKVVLSVDEQKNLSSTRRLLRRKISSLGSIINDFGIYVPREFGNELEAAISVANDGVREYNKKAKYTRLQSNFTVFEIGGGDERVAKALYDNTVNLLEDMNEAIEKGDIKALRYSIKRMRGISSVLPPQTGKKLANQIKEAREAAKEAVKAQGDSGTDKQKLEKAVKALQKVSVSGLKASLVETVTKMDKSSKKLSYVPDADLVKARAIEIDMKAEKPKKKASKKSAKKSSKKASKKGASAK